jgi:PAS domain S-box-containing protein
MAENVLLQPAFGSIFRMLPGLYLALNPDLTILDATDAYLRTTMASRESIVGKYFFDVFPNNPETPGLDSAGEFEYSLRYVLQERKAHTMSVLRYDLPLPGLELKKFETRYWSPSNTPVFDEAGNLIYILHEARDITEKILTEEASKHHNEQLLLLTSAMNAVAWEYNMVDNKLTWGKGLLEVFGYQPKDMGTGGESWDSRVHPDDFEELQQSITDAITSKKKLWTGEYRFRKADGTYAHVLDQGYIIYDNNSKPLKTIGSIIDLSHNKRIEQDLKESDARFRHLLENLPQMAWTADAKGKVLFFNANWYSYTGMPDGQTEGWINYIHPEDSAEVLTTWYNAIATGNLYELEYRIKDNVTGTYRTFLERGVPMYAQDGSVKLWVGTYTDIEDQKQILEKIKLKDQQIEKILELSSTHLCMLEGSDHICRYVSSGIYNLYGNRAYIGKPAKNIWPEFKIINILDKVFQNGEAVQINQFPFLYDRYQRLEKEEAYFNIRFQPIVDNEGNREGVLISAVEVTDAVKAERTVKELTLKLLEKEKVEIDS